MISKTLQGRDFFLVYLVTFDFGDNKASYPF